MSRHVLGICWVQNEFYAVHRYKGKHLGRWEADRAIKTLADFNHALADACTGLSFKAGGDVSIVYESNLLAHPFLNIPPMGARDMASFLARKADQEKPFSEEAAWSYSRTLSAREGEGVLLHLLPTDFRDAIIRMCEEFHLYPVTLLPLSEVMAVHVRSLPCKDDSVVLSVALFAGQCELLAVRGDGSILFVRDLGYGWNGYEDRLAMEIERSLLYAKQRFAKEVSHVWITGRQSELAVTNLAEKLLIPVSLADDESESYDWAYISGGIHARSYSNLIPSAVSRKRSYRQMLRVSMVLIVVLMLFSGLIAWQVERLIVEQRAVVSSMTKQMNQLRSDKDLWHHKWDAYEKSVSEVKQFSKASVPSIAPLQFTRYLATILPAGLVLTRVHVALQGGGEGAHQWVFEIQGVEKDKHLYSLPEQLKLFESALSQQVLHANISQSWRKLWLQQIKQGGTDSDHSMLFTIKGVIQ